MTLVGPDEPYVDDFPQAARSADWIAEPPAGGWRSVPVPAPAGEPFDQEAPPPRLADVVPPGMTPEQFFGDELVDDALPVVQVHGVGFLSRWLTSNPVRVWLYGVLLAGDAILVSKGLLTEADSYLWSALGASVLAVPLTEAVRGSVYSPRGAAALATRAVAEDRGAR